MRHRSGEPPSEYEARGCLVERGALNKRRVKGSADHPVDSMGRPKGLAMRVSMESLILAQDKRWRRA